MVKADWALLGLFLVGVTGFACWTLPLLVELMLERERRREMLAEWAERLGRPLFRRDNDDA